jgi:hypothetical protein
VGAGHASLALFGALAHVHAAICRAHRQPPRSLTVRTSSASILTVKQ